MNKGSYYKLKTKKWLEKKGYQVSFLERLQSIYAGGKVLYVKRDQMASDLLAVSNSEIIFVQVKFGKKNTAAAIKEFKKFEFPGESCCLLWIVIWELRAREPEIVEVEKNNYEKK